MILIFKKSKFKKIVKQFLSVMLGGFIIQYREFVIQGHQYENQDKFYQINPQMFHPDNIPIDSVREWRLRYKTRLLGNIKYGQRLVVLLKNQQCDNQRDYISLNMDEKN